MADTQLCQGCQQPMEVLEPGFFYHPNCIPAFTPVPGMSGMTMSDLELREDLLEVIQWGQRSAARSQQIRLGCSEVGQECDRRIGYTMAGIKGPNVGSDQWPATVGTAIHAWMAETFTGFMRAHGTAQWRVEQPVQPSPLIRGHCDLYDVDRRLVLDWKFPSSDNLRKMRNEGPSAQYMTQVQLYGLGYANAGFPVDRVGIAAVSRSGWLKDIFIHTVAFDPQGAQASLDRVYALGNKLIEMDIASNPQRWAEIPASPSRLCMWCPFYQRGGRRASDAGCPGKNET